MPATIDAILDELQELKKTLRLKEKPFLSAKEAAEYLNVSLPVIYVYSHRRMLKKYKVGKRIFFKIDDLNKLVLSEKNLA